MIKILGIVIVSLFAVVLLRKIDSVFALILTICSAIILFLMISDDFKRIIDIVSSIYSKLNDDNNYVNIMFKIIGISLLSQFLADICRDCGESAIANQTETAAKIIMLITVLPVFEAIINLVTGLLK